MRTLLCALVILLLGTTLSVAQEPEHSLRDLAAANDLYIGAAAFASHLGTTAHRQTLEQQYNMLTPEHEAKMCAVQPSRGRFDFRAFDTLVAFAEHNDMAVHGHTLVWHTCLPTWVEQAGLDRDGAISVLRDHIMTVVGRYKGRIPIWDVVNEAISDDGTTMRDTPWLRLIGDDYVDLAFQFAHEADPDALLFYNDFNTEGLNLKSDAVYELVSDMVARGIPIHGVGIQGHLTIGDTEPTGIANTEDMAANIQRLGELGLQVQITEIDVRHQGNATDPILQWQAADYRRILGVCLDSDYCTGYITWGVTDATSWLRSAEWYNNPAVAPLLFDDNFAPKPAYFAVADLLSRRADLGPILTDEEVALMTGEQEPITVDVPEPTFSDAAQLSPDSAPGAVYYAPFPLAITLDGETDDWANVPRVTIDSGTLIPDNHDTAMTFAVAADADNLYFLADVQDSSIVYDVHDLASEWYLEDGVEFYINATGDLAMSGYEPGVAQMGILARNLTNPDETILGGINGVGMPIDVVVVETEGGYRVEASVPLVTDVWNITPEHEGVLGFQAHLNGASDDSGRDTKLIWSAFDIQDQSWNDPSVFGQLVFWAVGQE